MKEKMMQQHWKVRVREREREREGMWKREGEGKREREREREREKPVREVKSANGKETKWKKKTERYKNNERGSDYGQLHEQPRVVNRLSNIFFLEWLHRLRKSDVIGDT